MKHPRDIRDALSMTKPQFARALGVEVRTVYRWEADEASPSGATAEALAGLAMALEDNGADPRRIRSRISLGLAHMVYRGLTRR